MKNFFTIGELAKILDITTKTLRHYEELGLLIPAFKNPITGYRYYLKEHIKEAYIIFSLKKMGISLKKIKEIKNGGELLNELTIISEKIEGEIKKLKKLKIGVDNHILKLKSTPEINETFEIKIIKLSDTKFEKIEFESINTVETPALYQMGMTLRKKTDEIEGKIYGLLDVDELLKGKYSCNGLIHELSKGKNAENEYLMFGGFYISLIYKGNPKIYNGPAMKKIKEYLEENQLKSAGKAYGRGILGAHTSSSVDDYLSEILFKIEEEI
ncbi:MerR family transcriptional regulator [Fusobacteria bacterium ZRK30]|nr:MerR family transcriptional regulator [Fusobacteria bacterium ZRK30]